MEWTRGPWMRALAVAASVALIVRYWEERGSFFWIGIALLALNVFSFAATRMKVAGGGMPSTASRLRGELDSAHESEDQDRRLSELLQVPGVAAAFAAGPQQWRQVSYLDEQLEPVAAEELAKFIWVAWDNGWMLAVEDEVKPYVDLDVEETRDPALRVLEAHPSVDAAWHEDREVYRVATRTRMALHDFATLAARALVAHHQDAVARLRWPE